MVKMGRPRNPQGPAGVRVWREYDKEYAEFKLAVERTTPKGSEPDLTARVKQLTRAWAKRTLRRTKGSEQTKGSAA